MSCGQHSALSIQVNIAKGLALADFGRFGNHPVIAYGSAVETHDSLRHCSRAERLLLGLLKKYRLLGR